MAALKSGEIEGFLKKPSDRYPIILVYGPDQGLVNERVRRLCQFWIKDPNDPFQLIKMDADHLSQDPQRLIDEALTIPLFAGHRVIWLRMGTSTVLVETIALLCSTALSDLTLIIEAGDLAPRHLLRAQIEKAPQSIALPCYADEGRNLEDLIDKILSQAGQKIERDARQALVERLGADRLMSRQEIEKLSLYAQGQNHISLADVDAVMADTGVINLDRLIDATFSGQSADCDEMLRRCLAEGLDVGYIVSALLRHALTLQSSRLMRDAGKDMRSIEQAARVHFRRQPAFQKQVNHWSSTALDKAVLYLSETQALSRKNAGLASAVLSRCCLQLSLASRRSH